MGRTACTEPQCLYKGALYFTVELYLYSPCGPYGLYRASVPVQGCTLLYSRAIYSPFGPYGLYRASVPVQGCTLLYSRAIPLFPLWAVRPVQSLSACTRVHFTFTVELYLYSPYGPYGLYRASVSVQGWPLLLPFHYADFHEFITSS